MSVFEQARPQKWLGVDFVYSMRAVLTGVGRRLFHLRVCMVAGVGFFTDAYDIFAITIAATMLGYCYGPSTCTRRRSFCCCSTHRGC